MIGAGPVGLATAHELARRGITVRLIDGASGPATTSRAIATHPRTLEMYEQMGVMDAMHKRGREIRAFTVFQDGKRLARLDADYRTMPTRFPFTLAIEQTDTEGVLREALTDLGVAPEWGVRLTSLEQDDEQVTVQLEHADGTHEAYSVPWVVGCDGGHSVVRKQLNLKLIGDANNTWLLADAPMTTELPPNSIYWVRTQGGTLMTVPLADNRWRLLDTKETDYDGDPEPVRARFERKLSYGLGHKVTIGEPTWISRFTAQQRMVPQMRVGRCMVAGDAAHVHSPASGQGMNTGIQEGVNLSWKLTMVINGQARAELLDSYTSERVPVGEAMLEATKKAAGMIELRSRFTNLALPVVFGVVSNVPPIRRRMQREMLGGMSGLLLSYADGPLAPEGEYKGKGPAPGTRVCEISDEDIKDVSWQALAEVLRQPRSVLLYVPPAGRSTVAEVASEAAERHGEWLSVVSVTNAISASDPSVVPDGDGAIRTRLGLSEGGWALVRPDGYVLDRGDALTRPALDTALKPLRLVEPTTAAH